MPMNFRKTRLLGAYIVEIEKFEDERGFFARTWCQDEFNKNHLISHVVQASISFNKKKGTLRGLHYQAPPCQEGKLVRCTQGVIFDVIVDIRPDSPTYIQHMSVVLSAEERNALYIPPGFAHGFQTLEDNTEIFYQMTEAYNPRFARGFRWNDPAFNIQWPADSRIILERDKTYQDFDPSIIEGFKGYV